jgi:RNA polymerase sigma-70 factor (ECF subfamily)
LLAFIKNINDGALSDQELISRYRQTADMNHVATLFQRYTDLLFGVCLKYLKDPETAKDAVMQIFEELVKKLGKHEIDNFKSWLYTFARNHCLMQLRTPRNLTTVEFNADSMHFEEELHLNGMIQKEETFLKMEQCLKTLSREQQLSVQLFYFENKCYKEISEITGIEWNKVRSFIQNGRRNLKICMEKASPATKNLEEKYPGK